jgi:hypothetical protein
MLGEIRGYLSELECFVRDLAQAVGQAVEPQLVRAVHTLAGTLSMAPLGQEAEVARALEDYLDNRLKSDRPVTQQALFTVQTCLHRFHQRAATLEDGEATSYPRHDAVLLDDLAGLAALEDSAPAPTLEVSAAHEAAKPAAAVAAPPQAEAPAMPAGDAAAAEAAEVAELGKRRTASSHLPEEAAEVLERCDTLLNTWRDKLRTASWCRTAREIHTQGGARMAGLEARRAQPLHGNLLEHVRQPDRGHGRGRAGAGGCDNLNLFVSAAVGLAAAHGRRAGPFRKRSNSAPAASERQSA